MTGALTADLDDFEALLGPGGVVRDVDPGSRYVRDWSGDHHGRPLAVLRPRTTEEVAAIVRHCVARHLPIVPQGGHTGLVAGAVPSARGDEVVVSLERMDRIRAIDRGNFSMVAEAGCVLETVHRAAEAADRYFPLALGAQGSCQIGGNVATNAGGLNVLRYGMTRDLVLGLEVVLPDGRVWDGLGTLRKDNTGYDLKQLFLGAEGTLGIVTAAVLKLFPRPTQVETAFLAVPSTAAAMALYAAARTGLSDLLSAFELLQRRGVELSLEAMPGLRDPLASAAPVYVLMEASASGLVDLRDLVERFLAGAADDGLVVDGALAASSAQAAEFWRIREGMIEAQVRRGRHLRTDVSIPISSLARFMDEAAAALERIAPDAIALGYGHVGDGNVHLNVVPPPGLAPAAVLALLERCEDAIFDVVDALGGSISAEHGIGRIKRSAFLKRVSETELDLLQRIKTALDPAGLMNPGRILPDPS